MGNTHSNDWWLLVHENHTLSSFASACNPRKYVPNVKALRRTHGEFYHKLSLNIRLLELLDFDLRSRFLHSCNHQSYIPIWTSKEMAMDYGETQTANAPRVLVTIPLLGLLDLALRADAEWIVINPVRNDDSVLTATDFEKFRCGISHEVWPYIKADLQAQGLTEREILEWTESIENDPDENPKVWLEDFKDWLEDLLEESREIEASQRRTARAYEYTCSEYSERTGLNPPEEVKYAVEHCKYPAFITALDCPNCGERLWHFVCLSPTCTSAKWKCGFCDRQEITRESRTTGKRRPRGR